MISQKFKVFKNLNYFAMTQLCQNDMYIENKPTLAILQISKVYHNTFQIVDYIMTNLQKIRFTKMVEFEAEVEIWES